MTFLPRCEFLGFVHNQGTLREQPVTCHAEDREISVTAITFGSTPRDLTFIRMTRWATGLRRPCSGPLVLPARRFTILRRDIRRFKAAQRRRFYNALNGNRSGHPGLADSEFRLP